MKRRREKVYGKWMSHFEVRYMMRRASKASAAGVGMTYKQWREYMKHIKESEAK